MGYELYYCQNGAVKKRERKGILRIIALLVLLAAMGIRLLWQTGSAPWLSEAAGAGQALFELAERVRAGEPLREAVTAVCKEVIDGAEMIHGA